MFTIRRRPRDDDVVGPLLIGGAHGQERGGPMSEHGRPSRREAAAQEIAEWLAGSGQVVLGAVLVLLLGAFVVGLFWR